MAAAATARRCNASRCQLVVLVLALLTVVGSVAAPPAAAQQTGAVADITITAAAATAAFPEGIDFSLTATSPDVIAEVELLWRPALEETLTLELPDFTPGPEVAVQHQIDLGTGTLPPGLDIHYHWRLTEADGDIMETPEQAVLWEDGRFDWVPVSSGLVTVYAYADDATYQAEVLASADATIDRLSRRFGATLTDPVRIWVYSSSEDFTGSLAPNSEPWIVGASYPWFGLVNAVLPTGDQNELGRVVPHEISHLVLYQATQNPFNGPPAWLDEGLATHAQGTGLAPLWTRVAAAADTGTLDRLRSLNGQFPYDSDGALLAYAESLSVVQYIIDTYGETGLSKLIAIFRDGVSYDQAVEQTLGIGLDELDDAWRTNAATRAEEQLAALVGSSDQGSSARDGIEGILVASGSLVMGLAAVVALILGVRVFLRGRKLEPEPDLGGPADGLVVDSRARTDPLLEHRV